MENTTTYIHDRILPIRIQICIIYIYIYIYTHLTRVTIYICIDVHVYTSPVVTLLSRYLADNTLG